MNYESLKKEALEFTTSLRNNQTPYTKVFVYNNIDISNVIKLEKEAIITVENIDCLEAVKEMKDGVVLNLASDYSPGGGWGRTIAQEESIFYRSTAHLSLHKELYPLKSKVLYTPLLGVFKDNNYRPTKLWNTSMITCAGIRQPRLINGMLSEEDYSTLLLRIERILSVAISHGHRNIVLGALGCGAFRCPVYDVVCAFKQVIAKYSTYFEKMIFAVLEDSRGTFSKFKNEWEREQRKL